MTILFQPFSPYQLISVQLIWWCWLLGCTWCIGCDDDVEGQFSEMMPPAQADTDSEDASVSSSQFPDIWHQHTLADAAERKLIPVEMVPQQFSRWCWAAVTQSYLLAYGLDVPQCEIVETAIQLQLDGAEFGDCCLDADNFDETGPCNRYNIFSGEEGSVQDLLEIYGSGAAEMSDALSFDDIVAAISANKPVIVQWLMLGATAHFVIINGYMVNADGVQMVYYIDPWPGEGVSLATYNWMRGGSRGDDNFHVWHRTLVGSNGASYRCDAPKNKEICAEWDKTITHQWPIEDNSGSSSSCAMVSPFFHSFRLWEALF